MFIIHNHSNKSKVKAKAIFRLFSVLPEQWTFFANPTIQKNTAQEREEPFDLSSKWPQNQLVFVPSHTSPLGPLESFKVMENNYRQPSILLNSGVSKVFWAIQRDSTYLGASKPWFNNHKCCMFTYSAEFLQWLYPLSTNLFFVQCCLCG